MTFNLIKRYPQLLELSQYTSDRQRNEALLRIYKRDIEDYVLMFRGKRIYPIKDVDGETEMSRQFTHLTCKRIELTDENGRKYKKSEFDAHRSKRLHWIKPHTEEKTGEEEVVIFSVNRTNPKTIIYNRKEKYVVVLLPQKRSGYNAYYMETAYYLDEKDGVKRIENQYRKKLDEVY